MTRRGFVTATVAAVLTALFRPGRGAAAARRSTTTTAAGVPVAATPVRYATTNGDVCAVRVLYLGPWSYVAIGGNFTRITLVDGTVHTVRNFAVLDELGRLVAAPEFDGFVYAIVAVNSKLFAGGAFTHVNGITRNRAAALSTDDWHVLPWTPAVADTEVTALAFSDTAVYLGSNTGVRAVTQAAGSLLWHVPTTLGPVRALLAVHSLRRLYVGGLQETPGQHGLVALALDTGVVDGKFRPVLRPDTGGPGSGQYDGDDPLALCYAADVGAVIAGCASVHDNTLRAVDAVTGQLRWALPTPGDCQAVAVLGTVVVEGHHKTGADRPYAGMYRTADGATVPWDGGFTGPYTPGPGGNDHRNGGVQTVDIDVVRGYVYCCGSFTQPAKSIAVFPFIWP